MIPGSSPISEGVYRWPTTEEVWALRRAHRFTSPIPPLEPGDVYWVFCDRGTYEFICHPMTGLNYEKYGIKIDDVIAFPTVVDRHPFINGIQYRVQMNVPTDFKDSAEVK